MNIQEKIKELGLVPLFPDYYYFNSSKSSDNDTLQIKDNKAYFRQEMRFKRPLIDKMLDANMDIYNDTFNAEMHFVIRNSEGIYDGLFRDDYVDLKFDNLPDVLNFFNEKYENVAKVFNQMLLEKLKDELEEEKKKQEEKEQQEQEKSDEGKPEKDEKEEGEGEGEPQEGEGEGEKERKREREKERKREREIERKREIER